MDASLAHIDHSLPSSDVHTFGFNSYNIPAQAQGARTAVVSGSESMSRYGIQGSELFSNGMSAFFRLEGAFNAASGQIADNGRSVLDNANTLSTFSSASAINGQAFSTEQTSEFDPLHASGLYSPLGYSGTIGGGLGLTENTRLDNSVRCDLKVAGVRFGHRGITRLRHWAGHLGIDRIQDKKHPNAFIQAVHQ